MLSKVTKKHRAKSPSGYTPDEALIVYHLFESLFWFCMMIVVLVCYRYACFWPDLGDRLK